MNYEETEEGTLIKTDFYQKKESNTIKSTPSKIQILTATSIKEAPGR